MLFYMHAAFEAKRSEDIMSVKKSLQKAHN